MRGCRLHPGSTLSSVRDTVLREKRHRCRAHFSFSGPAYRYGPCIPLLHDRTVFPRTLADPGSNMNRLLR